MLSELEEGKEEGLTAMSPSIMSDLKYIFSVESVEGDYCHLTMSLRIMKKRKRMLRLLFMNIMYLFH